MVFGYIPDVIWIAIFESVDSPAQLAMSMRTCCRFRLQATPARSPLDQIGVDVAQPRSLEMCVYRDMVPLLRKLTFSVPFNFSKLQNILWNLVRIHVFFCCVMLIDLRL